MKYLVFLLFPLLVACEERYRYPCQDPKNWGEEQCKKPYCSANGTCPEDLTHYEKNKVGQSNGMSGVQQAPSKGECK